jgi:hypothetical protein
MSVPSTRLIAKKGDQEIFRRETPSVIKRDLP